MTIAFSITKPAVIATAANASGVNVPINELEQLLEDIVNGVQKAEVLRLTPIATPGNPASGEYKLYIDSGFDMGLYLLDSAGNKFALNVDPAVCEGRLTLTSGLAITTADVLAATTLYFTPHRGHKIALFNGTVWSIFSFSEVSLSLAGLTASTPYDIWAYSSGSAVVLEALTWTNDTTRATALALQNGVYVKAGATTRRYLGTIRITSTIGQCEDSISKRYVWNYYNQVERVLEFKSVTASWTYATNTWRQANAATTAKVSFVYGVAERAIIARVIATTSAPATTAAGSIAIGLDSTTTPTGLYGEVGSGTAAVIATGHGSYEGTPAVGHHDLNWLEKVRTGTITFYGDITTINGQSGIQARITS